MEPVIVHITSATQWERAAATGSYEADSLATEGFIHFSFPHQIVRVANAFYRGDPDLVVLVVDPGRLRAPLKFEVPEPGAPEYPHLYGELNIDAVTNVIPFVEGPDGYEVPAELGT
ncbi:MAG: DUF952 domain-containing protein [Actinomycetota bacterium]